MCVLCNLSYASLILTGTSSLPRFPASTLLTAPKPLRGHLLGLDLVASDFSGATVVACLVISFPKLSEEPFLSCIGISLFATFRKREKISVASLTKNARPINGTETATVIPTKDH